MGKSANHAAKQKVSKSGICEFLKNAGKTFLFFILLPPMLNYGGLKKESEYFRSSAILFDIGFGQQLFMNCSGSGTPTVILDAPTGIQTFSTGVLKPYVWAFGPRVNMYVSSDGHSYVTLFGIRLCIVNIYIYISIYRHINYPHPLSNHCRSFSDRIV